MNGQQPCAELRHWDYGETLRNTHIPPTGISQTYPNRGAGKTHRKAHPYETPLIHALATEGKVSRAAAEAQIGFRNFPGEPVPVDVTEAAADENDFGTQTVIGRNVPTWLVTVAATRRLARVRT